MAIPSPQSTYCLMASALPALITISGFSPACAKARVIAVREPPEGVLFMPCGELHWSLLTLPDHPLLRLDTVSLADIMLAPQIDFFVGIPEWETLAGPHSNLRSWITRMNERPSMKATTWPQVNAMAQAA